MALCTLQRRELLGRTHAFLSVDFMRLKIGFYPSNIIGREKKKPLQYLDMLKGYCVVLLLESDKALLWKYQAGRSGGFLLERFSYL